MQKVRRFLWIIVFILTTIGIGVATRRILIISGVLSSAPDSSSGTPVFKDSFSMSPLVTMLHVLPGLLFMILGPIQFMKSIRKKNISLHRKSGRLFLFSAYLAGFSACVMPFVRMPVGRITEAAGSIFFATFFLIAVSKAFMHVLKKEILLHREWMLRAYAIGLAIATVRPIMALSFAFFHMQPKDFLGTAFWLGFTLHIIAAEVWINYTRNI